MTRAQAAHFPHILLVSSDEGLTAACTQGLRHHFGHDCVTAFSSGKAAAAAGLRSYHLAIISDACEDADHLVATDALLAERPDLPILVLLTVGDPGSLVEAVQHGAADAVRMDGGGGAASRDGGAALHAAAADTWAKQELPFIVEKAFAAAEGRKSGEPRLLELRSAVSQLRLRNDALEQTIARLETMAWTDPLTGLANRRQIEERLPQLMAEATRYKTDIACIAIDLDGFKSINDELGHAAGDELLRLTGRIIDEHIRASDIAVRVGGDEFVVVMPQSDAETAIIVARRLYSAFCQRSSAYRDGSGASCGMSIGVASLRDNHPQNGHGLICAADAAMYASKRSGRNRIMTADQTGGFIGVTEAVGDKARS